MTPRRSLVAAAAVALLGVALTAPSGAATGSSASLTTARQGQVTPAPSGVPLFIGVGSPPTDGPVTVTSSDPDIPAGADDGLAGDVDRFFSLGGTTAQVLVLTSLDAPTLEAALPGRTPALVADLLAAPALSDLDGDAWVGLAAILSSTAARTGSIALLDPPTSVVAAAAADPGQVPAIAALADQLRAATPDASHALLYSSGFIDPATGATVPAGAVGAALFAAADAATGGPWTAPGGSSTPVPLQPALVLDDTSAPALDQAGVVPLRPVPGYGVIVWGTRTVAADSNWQTVDVARTIMWLEQSVRLTAQSYVFQPNDQDTWTGVQTEIVEFLTSVWQAGGLQGATAAQAFQVAVGVPATMTAQDVLNGIMNVSVQVALTAPGQFITLNVQQQMQTA